MTFTLRNAAADDLMAVGSLHQRSRVATYSTFLPPEALAFPTPSGMGRYWVERWSYEREDHLMTVAERDGRLVGFTYVGPDELDGERDPYAAMLHAIHVEPGEQGRGTGRALMRETLRVMRSWGRTRATLWVFRENTGARRFYERGGWCADGLVRGEHYGPVRAERLRYARPI